VRPKIIVCLGITAARFIFDEEIRITRVRGVWRCKKGIWMLATYHPAALLRDESKKAEAWADMKAIKTKLEELASEK
jgi:DNA polymerase